jgi:ribulose-phosphate 3-epimerase
MLKASVSLWSADLTNLEAEIKRVESYAYAFHIDVADGRYANTLLFFPELVAAINQITAVPLEDHLITYEPEKWIEPFAQAGADTIIFYPDATDNPGAVVEKIKSARMKTGLSLAVRHSVTMIEPYLPLIDLAVVLGTDVDVKDVAISAEGTCEKIAELKKLRERKRLKYKIEADGAIRKNTVPLLREAGADIVVPGSLMFENNPQEISHWLGSL